MLIANPFAFTFYGKVLLFTLVCVEMAVVIVEAVKKNCLLIWRSFAEEYGLLFKPLSGYAFCLWLFEQTFSCGRKPIAK